MTDAADPADATGTADEQDHGQSHETRLMRRAVDEIRREGWKVAVIYGAVDAALVTVVANLLLSLASPSFLPASVPVPSSIVALLRRVTGWTLADPAIATSAVVATALGVAVFAVEVAARARRPLVEQFEAANPGLAESLRTARDAVEAGRDTRIARRLYEEVVGELRRSSSVGLLDLRRLTATLLVLVVASAATVPLAAVDVSLGGGGGPDDGGPPGSDAEEFTGLQDPSSILGDPSDVPDGEEDLDAVIDTSGSGSGEGTGPGSPASYDDSGFAGGGDFESQQAGFAEGEQLEDADLIREYNLQIREATDE